MLGGRRRGRRRLVLFVSWAIWGRWWRSIGSGESAVEGEWGGDGALTALSDHECHFTCPCQTFSWLICDPICIRRIAQADEHARDNDRDNHVGSNESVHENLVRRRILDSQ